MQKLIKERVDRIITWTVLFILGIFCYFYSLFPRNFAELNIQFSFLNFPIFVGEILFLFCSIVLFIKWKIPPIKFNRWHGLLFAYILFILFKLLYGYFKWGPLACRNAALFYYALFAVIGYYFYVDEFFENKFVRYTILIIFIATIFLIRAYKTYYFNYFLLTLLFFMNMKVKNRIWKYVFITLFVIACYRGIVITLIGGRSILVSSFFGYLFLCAIVFLYFVNIKMKYKKLTVLFLVFFLSLAMAAISSNKTAIKSLVDFRRFIVSYQDSLKKIEGREYNFKFANPPVKIYEKETVNPFFKLDFKPKHKSTIIPEGVDTKMKISGLENKNREESIETGLINKTKEELIGIILERGIQPTDQVETKSVSRVDTKPISQVETKSVSRVDTKPISQVETKSVSRVNTKPISQVETKSVSRVNTKLVSQVETKPTGKTDTKLISQVEPKVTLISEDYSKESILSRLISKTKKELIEIILENKIQSDVKLTTVIQERDINDFQSNMVYRLFMYQDMFEELFKEKRIIGLDFGKPFRSKKLEIGRFDEDWKTRVGWLEPHNAYVHYMYRAGIVGLFFIIIMWKIFIMMAGIFIKFRNVKGLFLTAILLYWLMITNFLVVLELPYFAIPFWSLFGMTLRYCHICQTWVTGDIDKLNKTA